MKQLFQYYALLHKYETNEKGDRSYKDSEILLQPTFILAKSDKEVAFKATRLIPDEAALTPEDVQIIIRPF